MAREIISTPNAPKAIGTYSQAVKVGKTVYVSGQIALDPTTGELQNSSIEVEIRRVFDNLKAIVTAAGGNFSQVTRATVFILDFAHLPDVEQDHGGVLLGAVSLARHGAGRRLCPRMRTLRSIASSSSTKK